MFYLCNTLWMHNTILMSVWYAQLHIAAAFIALREPAFKGYIFTIFLVMSSWYPLASAITQ